MKKCHLTFLIGIMFLMASCANIPESEATPPQETKTSIPNTISISPASAIAPSATVALTKRSTDTPLPPSPTPSETNTPNIPPEANLMITCLQVVDEYPDSVVFGGTLVIGGYQDEPTTYLWNLETGEKIDLPDRDYGDYAVSPDGTRLAFTELGDPDDWIRIVTADGQQQSIPQIENWAYINQWLDDENLIIDQTSETIHSSVVLNINSGQAQIFTPNYPEIYLRDVPYRGWGSYAYTASVFDPMLTRVVYPATISENPLKLNYVIWDLQSSAMISNLELNAASVVEHVPVWSPSGNEFIVAYPTREESRNFIPDDELYSINRDGLVTKLTNLSAYFTVGVDIRHYSWSPDGHKVAFWMEPNPPAGTHDPQMELAILDLITQQVTLYCIPGDFRDGGWDPIWAQNSQQLLVKSLSAKGTGQLVILDVAQGIAVRIANDKRPYGWMISDP
jgi:WD40 repeat protein